MIYQTQTCKVAFPSQPVQSNVLNIIQQALSLPNIQILFSSETQQNILNFVWRYMEKCSALSFTLSYTRAPMILKQISHINFCELKQLSLQNDCISNIQSLILVDAKNLEKLSLNQNKISRVSCLKKNLLPNLSNLNLKQNPISKLKGIQFLNTIQLRIQDSAYDRPLGQQNLSCLLKIESSNLKILRIQSYDRIKSPKVDQMFKKKNIGIWIYRTQNISQ